MLPPEGDPQRPLHLAIRSVRLLGIFQLILGLLMSAATVVGALQGPSQGPSFLEVCVPTFLLAPGVLFIIVAGVLKRCKAWAATTGIVLASFEGLLVLLGFIASFFDFPEVALYSVILLVILAAMVQLIYHLSQSYAAMRLSGDGPVHGFEPILQTTNAGSSGIAIDRRPISDEVARCADRTQGCDTGVSPVPLARSDESSFHFLVNNQKNPLKTSWI